MKKIRLIGLIGLIGLMGLMGEARSQDMRAMFSYSTFYSVSNHMPYVETYLSFDAWTMKFEQQDNGAYRATAEVVIVARQGD